MKKSARILDTPMSPMSPCWRVSPPSQSPSQHSASGHGASEPAWRRQRGARASGWARWWLRRSGGSTAKGVGMRARREGEWEGQGEREGKGPVRADVDAHAAAVWPCAKPYSHCRTRDPGCHSPRAGGEEGADGLNGHVTRLRVWVRGEGPAPVVESGHEQRLAGSALARGGTTRVVRLPHPAPRRVSVPVFFGAGFLGVSLAPALARATRSMRRTTCTYVF